MTDRQEERLVELLEQTGMLDSKSRCRIAAEELLANGVIVPPCKVGDIVYVISKGNILPYYEIKYLLPDYFGKTVFLTKEEAEAKLKELKDNG